MQGQDSTAQAVAGNRSWQQTVAAVPLATKAFVTVNVLSFCLQQLSGVSTHDLSLSPEYIVFDTQIYRLVTSAFTHSGVLHLAFNMMSLLVLGSRVERCCGTVRFLLLVALSVLLTSCLYVLSSLLLGEVWMAGGVVGFSGVLFTLAVIESNLAMTSTTRPVFGTFAVPTWMYPLVLLFLLALVPG